MKYCLSSRQTREYLQKADEIKIAYRDRNIIYDYIEQYPNATFIIVLPYSQEVDWNELSQFLLISQNRLVLGLSRLTDAQESARRNIPFYFNYPIGSFYELQAAKELGVCYLCLGMPAFFKMDEIKKLQVPVRLTPHICNDGLLPRESGIFGQWVRPEDIGVYEDYVSVVEFNESDIQREQALYRIYHDANFWPGEFNILFKDFNYPGVNRLIPPTELTEARLNCGQRCQEGGRCRLCQRYIELAQPDLIKQVAAKIPQAAT